MNTPSKTRKTPEHRDAIFNIILVFLLILLQSWIADGVKDHILRPLRGWLEKCLSVEIPNMPVLALMIAVGLGLAWLLYQRRRTFLPLQIQRIGEPDDVIPHAVLVLTMSLTGQWGVDKIKMQLTRKGDPLELSGTLDEALARMAALGEREKFSWEQLLRAVAVHKGKLRKVVLIGSPGPSGTALRFDECRWLIRLYFPFLPEDAFEKKEAGFDHLDDLIQVFQSVIRGESRHKKEIVIDVTGGTNVVSIAAAMVTLEHPEIEFQYVETHDEKKIRSFNVISGGIAADGVA